MKKLKERWGIEHDWEIVVIIIVFAITGSTATKIAGPITEFIGLEKASTPGYIFWPIRILIIFPIYQVLLVSFGWLFGQFNFFWKMEKKMLRRLGFKRFFEDTDKN